jgi:hypothetical protein
MNDQNRWEYEVQRHQEREETKRKLFAASIWGLLWTLFLALMWNILAA